MQSFPHLYSVSARAGSAGEVDLASPGLPALASAAPAEFGGPGDRWSPETLSAPGCFSTSSWSVTTSQGWPVPRTQTRSSCALSAPPLGVQA